jgi:hypothetical protein
MRLQRGLVGPLAVPSAPGDAAAAFGFSGGILAADGARVGGRAACAEGVVALDASGERGAVCGDGAASVGTGGGATDAPVGAARSGGAALTAEDSASFEAALSFPEGAATVAAGAASFGG